MRWTRIGRVDGYLMDRSIENADPSTVWLADLIEATEVVAASAEPCDPAIVKAFRNRLETRADVRRQLDPAFAQLSAGASERLRHVSHPVDFPPLVRSAILPGRASADQLKPHESLASEISSRQRCACKWRGPSRIVHYGRYRGQNSVLKLVMIPCRTASAQQRYGDRPIGITGASIHKEIAPA